MKRNRNHNPVIASMKINALRNKLALYMAIFDKNEKEIKSLTTSTEYQVPTSRERYHFKKRATKKLVNLICENNHQEARITKTKYLIKLTELSANRKVSALSPYQLYEYIKFIEDTDRSNLIPLSQYDISRINSSIRRLYNKKNKKDYLQGIVLKKTRSIVRKRYWKLRISQLTHDIEFHQNYIVDLKSSYASKFHARLVKRLEYIKSRCGQKKSTDNRNIIELRNVVKYYNNGSLAVKVLRDINLRIKYGEFVVILGPSGSGKTTLLNIISGMDTASYGYTIVAKENLIKMNSAQLTDFRRRNLGYIFQQYGLLPNLTVRENVEIGYNLQKDVEKRINIDELLKTINIFDQRNKYPHELSGGQQQRVSIARSMAKNPTIIFGDEPTGAIDEAMSKNIMQLFVDINKKFGTTIIIVTHNPIFADLATTVVKVADGKIADIIKNKTPKKVEQLKWSN
ncbi:MAG: ABC transporter ATP-binding protein [Mycoplasmataceae bacterium]|nr:ABC transporter ATP-binding protein [Mycoplasmataceae bacterium]